MDSKTRNKIVILGTVIGSVLLSYSATVFFIPNAYAINNTEAIGGLAETVDVGIPFYIQHYQSVVEKPQSEDEAGNFTGEGILNGSLSVSAIGNSTETLRNNDTVYIRGNAKYFTDSNMDMATYNFDAIGNYRPDGTFESRGVAIFDDVATGKLSFLNNSVAICKDRIDTNGNGTFLMWHWK
ncbi:MAG: hypothetical protein ACRD8Z_08565 [Nitrososphaeraceae archaeon]